MTGNDVLNYLQGKTEEERENISIGFIWSPDSIDDFLEEHGDAYWSDDDIAILKQMPIETKAEIVKNAAWRYFNQDQHEEEEYINEDIQVTLNNYLKEIKQEA